jgi:hypothetical protein
LVLRLAKRVQLKDKLRAAAYRNKIKQRDDYLPKRINDQQKTTDDLIMAAKGLGRVTVTPR